MGYKKWADAPWTTFAVGIVLVFKGFDTPNARAKYNPDAFGLFGTDVETCMFYGLNRRCNGVLREKIYAPLASTVNAKVLWIKVFDFGGKLHAEIGGVKFCYGANTCLSVAQCFPIAFCGIAIGGKCAHASDDHPALSVH